MPKPNLSGRFGAVSPDIRIRISEELLARLDRVAAGLGRTRSELARRWLEQGIRRAEKGPARKKR